MGFDILGRNATSQEGEYFRNNVWWWRPLADYIVEQCNLDAEGWFDNGGHEVSPEDAQRIALTLDRLLASGEVKKYETEYMRELANLADVQCTICNGSGVRLDEFVQGSCNACGGKGHVPPFVKSYPFSEENVREFAQFCRRSGGFTIG
jgi:hypothetical protein